MEIKSKKHLSYYSKFFRKVIKAIILFILLLISTLSTDKIKYFINIVNENSYSNLIKIENRIYYNKSFGYNYLGICEKDFSMKYNRKEPNDNSNILITLILAYSNPFQILQKKFDDYIDVLSKEIDFNFSLVIITYNNDISNLMRKKQSQIKYFAKFTLKNINIPDSKCFSFITYSNNKTIDIFYTNIKLSLFENFIKNTYNTSVNNHIFSGYYAVGTNLYAYAPSHIGLFDYFDFFMKFDHDLPKQLKINNTFEPFPLKKMIKNNKYFFFGCILSNDRSFVTNNLYKTFFVFILKQSDKCNYTVLPINLYKLEESISSPGAVNICWLGFYSMLTIRHFSEEYISAPYGLYKNRWGDQQFFIPTLYGFNYSNFSYFNKNTYLCSWLK